MAQAVYIFCALTSMICAVFLIRGYQTSRTQLLLWASACFFGMMISNIVLVIDLVYKTEADLSVIRTAITFVSCCIFLYGLIREST